MARRVAAVTNQSALLAGTERRTGAPIRRRVVGGTMLRVLGRLNPFMRERVEMNPLDDSALERLIGPWRKTPCVQGTRLTLDAARAKASS